MSARVDPARRLRLDIELAADGLSGVLRAGDQEYEFAGWLALMSVLGQAVDGPPPGGARPGTKD